jgi:ABC-type multidrug transport system ATPase subunit
MPNKLEIRRLSKQYGDFHALSEVSFTLEPGVTGLLGANGAGKSTLMKLMTDHMPRTKGEILWNSQDILTIGRKWRELVGYTPQLQGVYDGFTAKRFL